MGLLPLRLSPDPVPSPSEPDPSPDRKGTRLPIPREDLPGGDRSRVRSRPPAKISIHGSRRSGRDLDGGGPSGFISRWFTWVRKASADANGDPREDRRTRARGLKELSSASEGASEGDTPTFEMVGGEASEREGTRRREGLRIPKVETDEERRTRGKRLRANRVPHPAWPWTRSA